MLTRLGKRDYQLIRNLNSTTSLRLTYNSGARYLCKAILFGMCLLLVSSSIGAGQLEFQAHFDIVIDE
jgi:hypothetical protein